MKDKDYQKIFKKIYYDLYSNSNTSRAERIVSDITKVLLYKLICEKSEEDVYKGNNNLGKKIINILKSEYPETCAQFDSFSLNDDSLRFVLDELKTIMLSKAPAHIIGDAFQGIIGPGIRGDKGQFFTPRNLVKCMVEILPLNDANIIMDPACGTGGFLSEAYMALESRKDEINSTFIGIDKDKDMADLSLVMTEIVTKGNSEVYNYNSLELLNEKHKLSYLRGRVDVIITNPPFGSKIGVTDKSILELYEFGYNWKYSTKEKKWHKLATTVKAQDPQILFIELSVRLLKEGGYLGIILPEGVFGNKSLGYVWEYLKEKGKIIGMIDCPRNTFQPSTDTKTNILFFRKEQGKDVLQNETWIAVAKHCGHDKRGRTINSAKNAIKNDFEIIGKEFSKKEEENEFWKKVILNDTYFVPRYYENQKEIEDDVKKGNMVSIGDLEKNGFLTIKSGNEVGSEAYGTGSIPFIRTSDINNFEVSSDPTNSISDETYETYSRLQKLKEGDILFIADGRYRIGKSAILNKYNLKCVVQSHIEIISLSEEAPFTPYEFFYILNSVQVQEQIRNLVFIQSTLGTLGNRIREIYLPYPDKTKEWEKKMHVFQSNIETRAEILSMLKKQEYVMEL